MILASCGGDYSGKSDSNSQLDNQSGATSEPVVERNVTRKAYVQAPTVDQVTIQWQTDVPTDSKVIYGAYSGAITETSEPNLLLTTTEDGLTTSHSITLKNLSAAQRYVYQIGDSQGVFEPSVFQYFDTFPVPGSKASARVLVLGGSGENTSAVSSVLKGFDNYSSELETDLVLLLGDNVPFGANQDRFTQHLFGPLAESLSESSLWSTLGENELSTVDINTGTGAYFDAFSLPANGSSGGLASQTEAYYAFDYGDVHFVSLNTSGLDSSVANSATTMPVDAGAPCSEAPSFFSSTLWPSLETKCVVCHQPQGFAATSGLQLTPLNAEASYQSILNYASSAAARDRVLAKSIGQLAHGGSAPFGSNSSSDYQNLSHLMELISGGEHCGVVATSSNANNSNPHTVIDSEMVRWLSSDLAQTNARWVVVFMHHSPHSAEGATDDSALWDIFSPIFDQYGVDLVLGAQRQAYERTNLITTQQRGIDEGSKTTPPNALTLQNFEKPKDRGANEGTVYLIAGAASSVEKSSAERMAPVVLEQMGSVVLDIIDNRIEVLFVGADGELHDQFAISRGEDTTPPVLLEAKTIDAETIALVFSERLSADIGDANSYAINVSGTVSGNDSRAVRAMPQVQSATLSPNGRIIYLKATGLNSSTNLNVNVDGVADKGGNLAVGLHKAVTTGASISNTMAGSGSEDSNSTNSDSSADNSDTSNQPEVTDTPSNTDSSESNEESSGNSGIEEETKPEETEEEKIVLVAPAGLVAKDVTPESLSLSWAAADEKQAIKLYRVYRNGELVGSVNVNRFDDKALTPETTYHYQLDALDQTDRVTPKSQALSVKTAAAPVPKPSSCAAHDYFTSTLKSDMTACFGCHVSGGPAGNTRLVLSAANDAGSISALSNFISTQGGSVLLGKTVGTPNHVGGAVFGNTNSAQYGHLSSFIGQLAQCGVVSAAPPAGNTGSSGGTSTGGETSGSNTGGAGSTGGGSSTGESNAGSNNGGSGSTSGGDTSGSTGGGSGSTGGSTSGSTGGSNTGGSSGTGSTGGSAGGGSSGSTGNSGDTAMDCDLETQFQASVKGDMGACFGCHVLGGVASSTDFILRPDSDALTVEAIKGFLTLESSATLLGKTIAQPNHSGGAVFVNSESAEYSRMSTFLGTVEQCAASNTDEDGSGSNSGGSNNTGGEGSGGSNSGGNTGSGGTGTSGGTGNQGTGNQSPVGEATDIVAKGVKLSAKQTLRKAAILLAGRLPTEQEYLQVDTDEGLRSTIKALMQGEGFAKFIYETGKEWFLTRGARSNIQTVLNGFEGFTRDEGNTYQEQNKAINDAEREPLELLRFIVENDRSYKEIVTADYVMMTANTSQYYNGQPVNIPGVTAEGWYPGKIGYANRDHKNVPYPHAGVLSTSTWLGRFPSTSTNRNRHRVRVMYEQFLGVDIEALGQRPQDDANGGEYLVPTMENPDCTSCHSFMDPAAAGFQVFNDQGVYSGNALASDYTRYNYPKDQNGEPWYKRGDNWYRDMFAPGFEGAAMPGGYLGHSRELIANMLASTTSVSSATEPAETIDVSAFASAIDSQQSMVIFTGRHERDGTSRSAVNIWVEFLDANDAVVARSSKIGSERAPDPSTVYLPAGVRKINLYTENFVREGNFKNLSVELNIPSDLNNTESALSWMTKRLAEDARFPKAAVRFWYKGLFNRHALEVPMDINASDYAQKLQAFQLQDSVLSQVANRFSAAGFKVKDLLLELVMSDWFRAYASSSTLTESETEVLDDLGNGRILKPYEIESKIHELLGYDLMSNGNANLYGGFDGGVEILDRNESATAMLLSIPDYGNNAIVCNNRLVYGEFRKDAAERILVPLVERDDVEEAKIKANLQYLHRYLLGEELELDSAEIDRSYQLFAEVQAMQFDDADRVGFMCEGRYYRYSNGAITGESGSFINDPSGTIRAWNAVLLYLLGDFLMLNE